MLHFTYEGHYDLTHGDETTPLRDMLWLFCKQQDDVYYIASLYNIEERESTAQYACTPDSPSM
jgi:hypothetical protein